MLRNSSIICEYKQKHIKQIQIQIVKDNHKMNLPNIGSSSVTQEKELR